jgi:hypothetical protein
VVVLLIQWIRWDHRCKPATLASPALGRFVGLRRPIFARSAPCQAIYRYGERMAAQGRHCVCMQPTNWDPERVNKDMPANDTARTRQAEARTAAWSRTRMGTGRPGSQAVDEPPSPCPPSLVFALPSFVSCCTPPGPLL